MIAVGSQVAVVAISETTEGGAGRLKVRWVWVLVCRRLAGCYPWSKAPYCSPVYSLQPAKPNVRSATVVPLTFSDGIGLST